MNRERLTVLARTVVQMKEAFKQGRDWDAWMVYQPIGDRPVDDDGALEEILYVTNQLDAKERNIIKTYQEASRYAQD